MKRVLYIGEGVTASHVIRPLELAEKLYSESICSGEEVEIHFACDKTYKKFIQNERFIFHEITSMKSAIFQQRLKEGKVIFDYEYLSECMKEDEVLLRNIKPSLIISDFRFTMRICAKKYDIPFHVIANAYWSPKSLIERPMNWGSNGGGNQFYSKKDLEKNYLRYVSRFLRDYNYLLSENDMEMVESIEDMYCSGDAVLYADIESFAPVSSLRENEKYIGPVTGKIEYFRTKETDYALSKIKQLKETADRSLVYLSMGSSGNFSIIENYLTVLAEQNVNIIVTGGELNITSSQKNVYSSSYLYMEDIMPYMDVAITNGGSGANYQAYEAKVPIIALPSNVDQVLACARIEQLKAGIVIPDWKLKTSDAIVNTLLDILKK